MTSKPTALLLADLGVTQSHSRPHVSNDNPFSEAQFKTLKWLFEVTVPVAGIVLAQVTVRDQCRVTERAGPAGRCARFSPFRPLWGVLP